MNVILKIPGKLARGTNTDIDHAVHRPGGNALVSTLALANWQGGVSYIGVIGTDAYGDELVEWMRRTGVDYNIVGKGKPGPITLKLMKAYKIGWI